MRGSGVWPAAGLVESKPLQVEVPPRPSGSLDGAPRSQYSDSESQVSEAKPGTPKFSSPILMCSGFGNLFAVRPAKVCVRLLERNGMKRRLIVAGVGLAVVATVIWIVAAWVGRRGRNDYSGTVETREIQIGSKVGGRVIEVRVEEGQ